MSGSSGIWGLSARNCAQLAVQEINDNGGILGRRVSLCVADPTENVDAATQVAVRLLEEYKVEGIVGVQLSSVRIALKKLLQGVVPYVYTPLYEGGEDVSDGVFAIGETPKRHLLLPLLWLFEKQNAKKWYLVGNNYIWPKGTHAHAKKCLAGMGGEIVKESMLPLGVNDYDAIVRDIAEEKPDAVLVSLVGNDSVRFNRAFAKAGLDRSIIRFSTVICENILLGIGRHNTKNLYSSSGYFHNLQTKDNKIFLEKYYGKYGQASPVLNALGESCYEGIKFFSALAALSQSVNDISKLSECADNMEYVGARGKVKFANSEAYMPIYLAQAEDTSFKVIKTFY